MRVKELLASLDNPLPEKVLSRLVAHYNDQERQDYYLKALQAEEFREMLAYMEGIEVYQGIVPLWTDGHSNYIGLYVKGPLKYRVCYISHEETDVSPAFRSVESFVEVLDKQRDADWVELTKDYPVSGSAGLNPEQHAADMKSINELQALMDEPELDDDQRCQYLFSLMALTPYSRLDALLPCLADEDMFVQERACEIMGFHRYKPAYEKLKEVAEHGTHNGKMAAKRALSQIKRPM